MEKIKEPMKNKLLPIIIFMLFMGLIFNNYRLYKKTKEVAPIVNNDRLNFLEGEKFEWEKREQELLDQNAQLILRCKELEVELEKKPLTIIKYKRNEKSPISRSASESITNILSNRYSNN